jgi:phosphoglycerol transferase MdoB-like AlkP superfamily enzyme
MATILRALAFLCYALNAILALGLAYNFIHSIIRWDWSPWWWFPAGILAIFVLYITGGALGVASEKLDRNTK